MKNWKNQSKMPLNFKLYFPDVFPVNIIKVGVREIVQSEFDIHLFFICHF